MAEGRSRDEWARTSSLLALIANAHRDPKKTRGYKPGDFNPFAAPAKVAKVSVEVLKDVFLHGMVPPQI